MDLFRQFEVQQLVPINFMGFDLSFTNVSLWMVGASCVALITLWACTQSHGMLRHLLHVWSHFIENLAQPYLKQHTNALSPFVGSLFLFIILGNVLGLLPYGFTFTSQLWVTLSLSVGVFVMSVVMGIAQHGRKMFTLFTPSGVPMWIKPLLILVEVVSFLSRPISLGLRLFANMVAGHIMLKIFASFSLLLKSYTILALLPFCVDVALIGFEALVACIQAYVFTNLTCIYLGETLLLHNHQSKEASHSP